ncbi:MAG: recombination-associated protein RdgC [Syntrophales bacterium]|jgi:recombination associated protein RdgC|nr:recombination-associated protein RdgC [Syntrophales bacterium]MCK9527155.1 recombination-associated protein RdgC [Syntrophales bacterium]MDX9921720.1 recombination-associated protein RdgC [Syntrophales bacterium]
MGFLQGTATFRRYRVVGELPSDFSTFLDRQIKLHAFRGLPAGPEDKSLGWTRIDNVLDTDFEYAGYLYGEYILFSLRIDRKILPPSLVRVKTMEAEQHCLREKGLKRLFREQRLEIKETIRGNLLQTAQPVPSFYEVCWNAYGGWLLFGSLSEKVAEEFEDLFKRTFSLKLLPFLPWDPVFLDDAVVRSLAALRQEGGRA